jgi:hypothetical protein
MYNFEIYDLQIIDFKDKTCRIKLKIIQEKQALVKDRRKLYIIQNGQEVLYIGEANCSIKVRFQRACSSYNYFIKNKKARGGYKGYKWLDKKSNPARNLRVSVAVFNSTFDSDIKRSFIEAVEGELVYLIRNKLKYWPKFQNEIHFKNEDGAKEIAEEIYKKISASSS